MNEQAIFQLVAVIVGGLIAITGGLLSNLIIERQKMGKQSYNLALAFRGEITAIMELIKERNYIERYSQVVQQIEESGEPFFMPIRIRYEYDRVYAENVERIGILKAPLPEEISIFYTRLNSILEDMVSLGDGTFAEVELDLLLRIYQDAKAAIEKTLTQGEAIIKKITETYPG
jgi:hypothetical protein